MSVQQPNSFRTGPDERGHFGIYGGRFVAETLMPLILDLDQAYAQAKADPAFRRELEDKSGEAYALDQGVKYVAIPKPGACSLARQAHEKQPWFRSGRRCSPQPTSKSSTDCH